MNAAGAPWGRFRPRWWPSLAALLGVMVLVALGSWQMQRLAWKEALIAARTASLAAPAEALPASAAEWRTFDHRHVRVVGRFRHDLEQLFGARRLGDQLGHQVLTPLVREGGDVLLVDRGWVPATSAHPATRRQGQVEGAVEIVGLARYRADDRPGWLTPTNQPEQRLWYGHDLQALAAALGIELLPIVVVANDQPNPGGLPIGGGQDQPLVNNHLGYALTWFALALALLVIYLLFSMQEREPAKGREQPMEREPKG